MSEKEFKFIKTDETGLWSEPFRKHFSITKVTAVYAYDPTERTHCCEIRPSYFMRYLGSDIEHNCSALLLEDLDEEFREAEARAGDSDCYMHCSVVDGMSPEIVNADVETLDDVIEEFHSNPW